MEGGVDELLGARTGELRLHATPLDGAKNILGEAWTFTVEEKWLALAAPPDDGPEIVRRLVKNGIDVHQVVVKQRSLEEFFMEVTKSDSGGI